MMRSTYSGAGPYQSVEVRVLTNQEATRQNILEGIQWLRRQTVAQDVAALLLAGHGLNDPGTGKYYYLPHDADLSAPEATMVSGAVVQQALGEIAGKALLFLDTCHAGNVVDARRSVADMARFASEMASPQHGVVV